MMITGHMGASLVDAMAAGGDRPQIVIRLDRRDGAWRPPVMSLARVFGDAT